MNDKEIVNLYGVCETLRAFAKMEGATVTEGMSQGLMMAAERLKRMIENCGGLDRITEKPEAPDSREIAVDHWVTISELQAMCSNGAPSTIRDKLVMAQVKRRRKSARGENGRMKSFFLYSLNDIREKVRSGKLKLDVQIPLDPVLRRAKDEGDLGC